jgi:ribosomal-protein-alanine N-acetyltransferase
VPDLTTPRLRLVPATRALIEAEFSGADRLGEALAAAVPDDWPPEHHDADTLRFWRDALSQPGAAGWWLHYGIVINANPPTLVASVGYKGPPAEGVVEVGYSVVPTWQRQGLATEAIGALVRSAWERGADTVIAHTLQHLEPSIGVLRKLGFTESDPPEPGVVAFTLRRNFATSRRRPR